MTNRINSLDNLVENTQKLRNRPYFLILFSLVLLKNGIHPIGIEWQNWLSDASNSFPKYSSYLSFSIIPIVLFKIMHEPSSLVWWSLHLGLSLAISAIYFKHLSNRFGTDFKKIAIVIFSLPLFISPYLYIGHYDLYTISAALLASATKKRSLIFLAACLATFTNVEQALVTSICLFIIFSATREKLHKTIFLIWSMTASVGFLLLTIFISGTIQDKRADTSLGLLKTALIHSFGLFHLIVFSLLGVAWFWVFMSFELLKNRLIFVGALFFPLILCIITVDRTRVGVAVGSLPILILFMYIFEHTKILRKEFKFYFIYFAFYLIIPSYFVTDFDSGGFLRVPYRELLTLIIG